MGNRKHRRIGFLNYVFFPRNFLNQQPNKRLEKRSQVSDLIKIEKNKNKNQTYRNQISRFQYHLAALKPLLKKESSIVTASDKDPKIAEEKKFYLNKKKRGKNYLYNPIGI